MTQRENVTGRVVPAVDRAARILALIEAAARPMSITELARELDASKGTVRDILETLRSHGLLGRDDETKRYRLGPQLVRLGASSREGQDMVAIARPSLQTLSNEQRESVLLLVPQGDRLLIQEAIEPNDPRTPILVSATPGRSIPIVAGACGKVIMAWSDEKTRRALIDTLEKVPADLEADLAAAREDGFTVSDEEFMEGVRGVSSPVLGPAGQLVGLVLVSGVVASLRKDRFAEVGDATRTVADSISKALGGPGIARIPADA